MADSSTQIVRFSNQSPADRKLLRRFVAFHWEHYRNEPQYIPLLNYEYLGNHLLSIHGFFEPSNYFFTYAENVFLLALRDGKPVGRCTAFVNRRHNEQWRDKTGFFGYFESVEDTQVAGTLLEAAADWLRARGMDTIRGPQNLPVNDATPGVMTSGFDSRPVVYYHYNKRYYQKLLEDLGFSPVKQVMSWEVPVMTPVEDRLSRVAALVQKRGQVTLERWGARPMAERKREMLEIYNEAWSENFGFVPFTAEEFGRIVDDMQLVMDKNFFVFAYVKGEVAAFMGLIPNIAERLKPVPGLRRFELLRALRMFLTLKKIRGTRLGYLGVRKKFRQLGLPALILWDQKHYMQAHTGHTYSDIGWVLEDNRQVISLVEMMEGAKLSKVYTIMEKPL
jgi:hypothetical protein